VALQNGTDENAGESDQAADRGGEQQRKDSHAETPS
jgi:hypothetical protein